MLILSRSNSGRNVVIGSKEPEVWRDIQLTDDMAFAEFAADEAKLLDTAYHQHGGACS